jgi:molybdenum cofactor biosynthesis enzyme MoaA
VGQGAAEAAGLTPVKINAVIARGFNEQDIADLARLTLRPSLAGALHRDDGTPQFRQCG